MVGALINMVKSNQFITQGSVEDRLAFKDFFL